MSSYFAKKFFPAPPVCVLGRSYRASPACKPDDTLYDNWQDHSRTHPHPMGTVASWERMLERCTGPGGPGLAGPGGRGLAGRAWRSGCRFQRSSAGTGPGLWPGFGRRRGQSQDVR